MCGNVPRGFLFVFLWFPLGIFAQDPEIFHRGEEELLYQEEGSEMPLDILEKHVDLRARSLQINCASRDQLAESELFSPYQIHNLIKYREKYGELYSILELVALPGFSLSRVQEIAQYLGVGPCTKKASKGRIKHMILMNVGQVFPRAVGYADSAENISGPVYLGSPVRTDLRIRSQLGNALSLGLTYEKDAGESYFHKRKPEYMSGYIQYQGYRQLKQLVLGNFKLHHGLGLVNGSGFFHAPEGYLLNRASSMRMRPYSSKSESRYERGLGIQLALKNIRLLYWASYRKLDLNKAKLSPDSNEINWMELLRETGLHRTANELSVRALGYRISSGIQGLYRHKKLNVGILFGVESAGLSKEGIHALGIRLNRGLNSFISLHGNFRTGKWNFFGEWALSDFEASALLAGVTCHINDFMQGVLLLHHYDLDYRGSFSSSYSNGSKTNNERGVAIHLQLEPAQRIVVRLSGELFHFPAPRYLCSVPSSTYKYALTMQNSGTPDFKWRIRILKKFWQSTPADNNVGLPLLKTHDNTRFDLRFVYDHKLQWQSRIIISYGSLSGDFYPGYALAQQISFPAWQCLKSSLQFVVFEVPDWEHRIYLYEPGLYYDFSFPVCYGSGQKVVATIQLKAMPALNISAKVALTSYRSRDTLGSGNDMIHGNEKWMLALQVRLDI